MAADADKADAVVVGGGVNGLVAANRLADAGWDVVVCEAQPTVGGACRSAEVTAPGFVTDLFSAFYPLGAASPVLRALDLEAHGLRWVTPARVVAHPTPDGRCAVLSTDVDATAAALAEYGPADAAAWRRQYDQWLRLREPLLDALVARPFPPVRPGLRLARTLGAADGLRFVRFALLPVRRFGEEEFPDGGGGLLLAGNALHTDLPPEGAGSAVFGWLLSMLGQDVGFPVPHGGSGRLTAAMASRLTAAGGRIRTSCPVTGVVVRGGRARGVTLAGGGRITARRAVLADVDAITLYRHLVAADHLPPRLLSDLERFQWDNATFKVNWALSGPIPWSDPRCGEAGTVHLGGTMDDLSLFTSELARSLVPANPFLIVGQMTTADPSRSPAGTESAWAYTHIPRRPRGDAGAQAGVAAPVTGRWDAEDVRRMLARVEDRMEGAAPGFRELIVGRNVQSPPALQAADGALIGGALNGGTAAIHQQLVFRPVPGLGRPETPVAGLYLASMSAHPSGGVHGGPGAMAATAALRNAGRVFGPPRRAAIRAAHRLVYSGG